MNTANGNQASDRPSLRDQLHGRALNAPVGEGRLYRLRARLRCLNRRTVDRSWPLAGLVGLAALIALARAEAATGDVDPTYAYVPDPAPQVDSAHAIAMPDGGWIVIRNWQAGTPARTRITLRRIDAEGRTVTNFGNAGVLTTDVEGGCNFTAAAIQTRAGEYLLGGWCGSVASRVAAVLQLRADGQPDEGFGSRGIVARDIRVLNYYSSMYDAANSLLELDDGRYLVGTIANVGDPVETEECEPYAEGQSELLRLSADGRQVASVLPRQLDWPIACSRLSSLQRAGAGEALFHDSEALYRIDATGTIDIPVQIRPLLYGSLGPPVTRADGGFAITSSDYGGTVLLRYSPATLLLNAPAHGAPYGVALSANAGLAAPGPVSALTYDTGRDRWYAGFGSNDGGVGLARFRPDGVVDTGWSQDGVMALPSVRGRYGLTTGAVRAVAMQSGDRVVAVLGDGQIFRVAGGSDTAIGGVGLARSLRATENSILSVSVTRAGGSAGAISVRYEARESSSAQAARATAGLDFQPVSGRFEWADGEEGPKSFSIVIPSDTLAEVTEQFEVVLSDVTGGAVLFKPTSQVVYVNDPAPPPPATTPPPPTPAAPAATGAGGGGAGSVGGLELLAGFAALAAARMRRRLIGRSAR